jgi:hypothetical protein
MGNLRASCKLSADFACSNLPDAFEQASNRLAASSKDRGLEC